MTDRMPDYFDDDAPTPDFPPDGSTEYMPLLADLEGQFSTNTYLVKSMREHPQIDWPFKLPPKRKNDTSFAPSPRHIENTARLVDAYGMRVRWNLMRHSFEITIPGFAPASERAENATVSSFLSIAQRHGLKKELVLEHLHDLADEYHPVRDWIWSKAWDGVDRFADLWGTLDLPEKASDSDRAIGWMLLNRWLVSCAAALLPPVAGRKPFTPQGVLTLQGAQGKGKTEWMKSLAPADSDWIYAGFVLDPHDRDSIQQVTSYWIVELGEVDATFKRSDASALKGFITKDRDVYRRPYARSEERIPRRTVLGATVNRKEFLVDETGNRRWWTIPITGIRWQHDIDTQQLWAQAYALAERGEPWWLTAEEQEWLKQTNRQFELRNPLIDDLWETWRPVQVYPSQTPPRVTLSEIWRALPGREMKQRHNGDTTTLLQALRDAGTENDTLLHGNATFRVERLAQPAWQPRHDNWRTND